MENEDEILCPKTDDEAHTHTSSSNGRVCGENGGNGRHPKKKKEKEKPVKIQQRGLGVAELEKIRLAEEEKNKGVVISSPDITPLSANNLYNRSGSEPLRPPFVTNTRSPYHFSYDNYYAYVPGNPSLNVGLQNATQLNSIGPVMGCPNSFFGAEGNGSNQMSSEYILELEKSTWSAHKTSTSDEPNLRTFPMQHGNHQTYLYSPSAVNHIAANSSSAVLNVQIELPLNQSLCGTYKSVQPDEAEKIVGTDRPHLLSPQDPPESIAHCKFNPFTAPSLERSTSFRTQGSFAINGNPAIRESLPCSVSMPNLQQRNDTKTDCATSDCGFLNLGLPATMSFITSSKSKQALSHGHTTQQAEPPKLDTPTYRVHAQGSNLQGGSNFSTNHHQQGPYPTFQPEPNNKLYGQSTVSSNHNNGDTEDNLDLSLKL